MAWVTPQTFVADEILTAAKLNQLVDAVTFLNDLSAGPLPPFEKKSVGSVSATYEYSVRHRNRYLHVVYTSDGAYYLRVKVNDVLRHEAYNPADGYNDVVLDTNAYGLVVGEFVTVAVTLQADAGHGMWLQYVTELSSTTSLV